MSSVSFKHMNKIYEYSKTRVVMASKLEKTSKTIEEAVGLRFLDYLFMLELQIGNHYHMDAWGGLELTDHIFGWS